MNETEVKNLKGAPTVNEQMADHTGHLLAKRLTHFQSQIMLPKFYTFTHFSRCLPIVCCHFRVFTKLTELSEQSKLPWLNFTQKQQMWIALTRFWCGGHRFSEESQHYQILREDYEGRYVPHPFRILEPFSNSKEFSQNWNCPKGSKMNRPTKCTVWGDDL